MSPVSLAVLLAALLAAGLLGYTYYTSTVSGAERRVTVATLERLADMLASGGASLPGGLRLEAYNATLRIDGIPIGVRLARITLPGCHGVRVDPARYGAALAPWGNGTACGLASTIRVAERGGVVVVEYYTPSTTGLYGSLNVTSSRVRLTVWATSISTPWGNVSLGRPVEVVVLERVVGGGP